MEKAKLVNIGVDTLVLNAFYTDERGRPVRPVAREPSAAV